MEATVDEAGKLRTRLTITCGKRELEERRQQLLSRYAPRLNLKGFRPGKTPKGILEKRYGQAVTAEAVDALIQEGLRQGMQEHELHPVGPVEVDESSTEDGIRHVVSFDTRPEMDLPDPATIEVPIEEVAADEAEVEEAIDGLRRRAGNWHEHGDGEAIAEHDVLIFSGAVKSGEETVREVHDLQHLLGGFPLFGKEPAVVIELAKDVQVGGELAFDTVLPDNFEPAEWAGKEARVELRVQQARRLEPAELGEEFFRQVGVADRAQLEEQVRSLVEDQKGEELRHRQTEALMAALVERTGFDLPPRLIERALEQQVEAIEEHNRRACERGDEEESSDRDEIRARIEEEVRRSMIVDAIADAEGVRATRQDIEQQIAMAAYRSGRQPDELRRELEESGRIFEVAQEIREAKAIALTLDRAVTASREKAPALAEAEAEAETAVEGGESEEEESGAEG